MVARLYLDTSVAVHALRGTPTAVTWFDRVTARGDGELVSSRILKTELTRVLRRDREPVSGRDAILDHVAIVPVTEPILVMAEAITDHVKTLDAVHLASAIALGDDVVVVTHDAGVKRVAESIGLAHIDPVER